jgi:hypothetical protein
MRSDAFIILNFNTTGYFHLFFVNRLVTKASERTREGDKEEDSDKINKNFHSQSNS